MFSHPLALCALIPVMSLCLFMWCVFTLHLAPQSFAKSGYFVHFKKFSIIM